MRGCTRVDTPHWIFNLGSKNLVNNWDYLSKLKSIYAEVQGKCQQPYILDGEKVDYKKVISAVKKL